jgi:hypothetical protein
MRRREPGTDHIFHMTQALKHDRVVSAVNNELIYQRGAVAPRIDQVFIHADCRPHEILIGPCSTLAGPLCVGEAVVHPETALMLASARPESFHPDLAIKEQPTMPDIKTKRFTRQRVEYWIPTGTYHGDGGRLEDTELARAWAKQELVQRGVLKENQSAEGHIRVKPHDEHVIVYIEFDEEQK